MKLMICGKGGCGKSTAASLLAFAFNRMGKRVLVADLDESNYGLHRQLGLELPQDLTLFFGSKKGIYRALDGQKEKAAANAGDSGAASAQGAASSPNPFGEDLTLDTLPSGFVSGEAPLQMVAIGKIRDAGEGCACAMGTLAREFLRHLRLRENEIAIADAEAGVEHFGRGVDAASDAVLMIVDPSYESVRLAGKVAEMCGALEKPLFFLINKADGDEADLIRGSLGSLPGRILGRIPDDPSLRRAGLAGASLREIACAEADRAAETLARGWRT